MKHKSGKNGKELEKRKDNVRKRQKQLFNQNTCVGNEIDLFSTWKKAGRMRIVAK